MGERTRVSSAMELIGFDVLPSAANFIFARHNTMAGAELALRLREQGIIVRHFDKPRIADFLRITIGTAEQNDELLQALKPLVG